MVSAAKKDLSWTSRRLRALAKAGFLLRDKKRREYRYFTADPLPEDFTSILPPPEVIERWLAENVTQDTTGQATTTELVTEVVPTSTAAVATEPEAPFDGMAF
jgi:hypothetical protein